MSELQHRVQRMTGRDPGESGRASTPLELLFDLTFVIAFGIAADELAHFLAEDHVRTALLGFAFAGFAISWAWINFSWFASAYDTDDWIFRLMTMLQMGGVLVNALGIASVFESIDKGEPVATGVMIAGYVVMRIALVGQWLRVAAQDPERRATALTYAGWVVAAQAGWVALGVAQPHIGPALIFAALLIAIELMGPLLAETRKVPTPWHPHHIAERYGLLVIIALGEGLLGTIAALGAIVGPEGDGWTLQAGVVGAAGVVLTFGVWWTYFVIPCGELLAARRQRSFGWGYGHIPLFAAIVAIGAGLHVAAYLVEHHTELSTLGTVLCTAVPLAVYVLGLYALYAYLSGTVDPFHFLLIAGSVALLGAAVGMAAADVALEWCLLVLAAVPWVTVVGYELVGHRHNQEVLEAL